MKPLDRITLQSHAHSTSGMAFGARWAAFMSGLVLAAQVACATTYTWTNTGTANYNVPANWDLNAVPGIADTAIMAAGGTALVDNTMTPLLTSLLMGGL